MKINIGSWIEKTFFPQDNHTHTCGCGCGKHTEISKLKIPSSSKYKDKQNKKHA